ncbi:MAG TPA: DUF6150 family protein [Bacteroidales bacterium]|nr:DUF6150 family protein [Bacteroidales bacterium]
MFALLCQHISAQKVYSVEYPYQADLKVFATVYNYQADLKVYKVEYDYQAGWRNKEKVHLMY